MDMEIRQGVVSRIKTARQQQRINPVREYIVSIDLDGYRVKFEHESHSPKEIATNDRLAVYGKVENGVFNAHAFRNFTKGKTSATQVRAMLYVSLIFLALTMIILHFAAWPYKATGLFLGAITLYCIFTWHHTSKGLKLLKRLSAD